MKHLKHSARALSKVILLTELNAHSAYHFQVAGMPFFPVTSSSLTQFSSILKWLAVVTAVLAMYTQQT